MQYVANGAVAVGSDEFVTKEGVSRYSILFANGEGQPHKVSCTKGFYDVVVPMVKRYDITINADTVGYNTYCDLVDMVEC